MIPQYQVSLTNTVINDLANPGRRKAVQQILLNAFQHFPRDFLILRLRFNDHQAKGAMVAATPRQLNFDTLTFLFNIVSPVGKSTQRKSIHNRLSVPNLHSQLMSEPNTSLQQNKFQDDYCKLTWVS